MKELCNCIIMLSWIYKWTLKKKGKKKHTKKEYE
jgi:hypothetical protein